MIAPDVNDDEEGFQGPSFIGVFDGNGHTISHVTIVGEGYLALFGRIESAEISNLGLESVYVNGGCSLVAYSLNANITTCYARGVVMGDGAKAGLVGNSMRNEMTDCYYSGTVSGKGDHVGGLVGLNIGTIAMSFSAGTVDGNRSVGGLVGLNVGLVVDSHSICSVSGQENVAGIIGTNGIKLHLGGTGRVINCHFAGSLRGALSVGGLIGAAPWGEVVSSFWDTETSGQSTSAGGTGKTTAEMKQQSTFEGWDFINVWDIGEGQTYPYLRTYSPADINQDGSVNFLNLAVLAENWLAAR